MDAGTPLPANQEILDQLFCAELQFRLAIAVRTSIATDTQPLCIPDVSVYGQHTVKSNEIFLKKEQADYASWLFRQSATFLLATEIKNAIISVYENQFLAFSRLEPPFSTVRFSRTLHRSLLLPPI